MIKNKVLRIKADGSVPNTKLVFKKNTEFEIVMDVVYMSGFPLSLDTQSIMYDWITKNPTLFNDITSTR